jgi:protease IV
MRGILKLVGISLGLFLVLVFLTASVSFIRHTWFGASNPSDSNHVQVIDVSGVIYTSTSFVRDLAEITDNKHTKAIVLRVNSPGGLVAPSQEMYDAIRKADEKIPVVVSMGSVAASGGYYIAVGGRKIFANSGTMTGSIGVIMEFANTQKLYQWAKMERFSITSGKFKDAGSPLKAMSAEDKALFQSMVSDIYSQFRGTVKARRGLTDAVLDKVADGRVLTGSQAHQAKLVDSLGGLEAAIAEAKTLAGLPEKAAVVYPDKSVGFLRRALLGEEDGDRDADSQSPIGALLQTAKTALPTADSGPSWRVLWLSPVH